MGLPADHAAIIREALNRLTADEHYRNAEENSLHRAAVAALAALVAQAKRVTELEGALSAISTSLRDAQNVVREMTS